MLELDQLHRYAREIFDHALSSVDPRKAVIQAMTLDASSRSIYAIAIGKAAAAMAVGLDEVLGQKLTQGVISAPDPFDSERWQRFVGGHPLPGEASLAAFAVLHRANAEQALVVFLISGGGSAMLEWPVNSEVSLEDLRKANQALIQCGKRRYRWQQSRCGSHCRRDHHRTRSSTRLGS